ncbi:MAG: GntR family transcriptional regulator [Desulfobacterales bacterium]|nr:GntR family transcriptional regulator [Desulfobacterales bacterium]
MKVESIADLAKRHIELWIIKGEYKPGQKLKEEEISVRLGISRPPTREAFKSLEAEGLVVRKPRRGVFVTEMTEKDVWEAYTLKATLYEMAIELAMDTIHADQVKGLESHVKKMEDCVNNQPVDLLRYQEHHQEFHDKIMRISGNDRLKKFSASIHLQVCRFSYKSLQNNSHLISSLRYHRHIVNALKERNKPLACKLMKDHVLEALDVLRHMNDLIKESPEADPIKAVASE